MLSESADVHSFAGFGSAQMALTAPGTGLLPALAASGDDLWRSRAVVVSYPDARSAERVLRAVRGTRPDIAVVVRTTDDKDVARLRAAGATEVIPEVLEGA